MKLYVLAYDDHMTRSASYIRQDWSTYQSFCNDPSQRAHHLRGESHDPGIFSTVQYTATTSLPLSIPYVFFFISISISNTESTPHEIFHFHE